MSINTSMMQNFGLEDLSHMQSWCNLLQYLVRVEMASDWFTRIYRFWQNKFPPKSRYGVQTRLRALLQPAKKKNYTLARRYEFYVLVARTMSHSFAALTHEILSLPLEHKIHIFSPPCNILYKCIFIILLHFAQVGLV